MMHWSMPATRGRSALALVCLLATLVPGIASAAARAALEVASPAVGMGLRVDPSGSYTIVSARPAWTFAGSVGRPLADLATDTGSDALGAYQQVRFSYAAPSAVRARIRLYAGLGIVLFTQRYLAPAAPMPFPALTSYPRGLFHLSYSGKFAAYSFRALDPASPWLFFDGADDAFLFSPAANFLVARSSLGPGGAPTGGIDPAIGRLPSGFTQQSMLVIGHGINDVYDTWGDALTRLQGKARPGDEAATELTYLGYWTDNGAAYYYHYDGTLGYAGTLLAVRASFRRLGIPLGYLQLDSWWYPKGAAATWRGSGAQRGGMVRYVADPALFPDGLAAFQRRLGVPLIVHARWIDRSSPYRSRYRMSGNVVVDPRYWTQIAAYLRASGVIGYEQDWLASFARTAENLRDPAAFLDDMASAMAAQGISLQYCMPLPQDLLQSTRYDDLLSVRVSDDHFMPSHWTDALYAARLAGALGAWPWDDVFDSSQTDNLLLATLSAGVVGVGDPLGALDAVNLRKAMRGDGVLIKPDAPLAPTDATYLADAAGAPQPMVAATYSGQGRRRALYIFAYARGGATQASFRPAALGLPGATYVYNYFTGRGSVLPPGATFRAAVGSGSYYVVVPIDRSGMALLGDLDRFVPAGRQRVTRLGDTGRMQVTLAFGRGERAVTISGYAPTPPLVAAHVGQVEVVSYAAATHIFSVQVAPGAGDIATLEIAESSSLS
jgi:hypothetical protein